MATPIGPYSPSVRAGDFVIVSGQLGVADGALLEGVTAQTTQSVANLSERLAEHPHRLFWIACGKDDFLVERNRSFNDQLNQRGIKHTYVETDGGHSWPVWRIYLPQFLEQIFR